MLVREVYQKFSGEPEIVNPDTSVDDLIQSNARHRGTRYLHVVDKEGKLVGIVGTRELMRVLGSQYLDRDTRMALPFAMAQIASDIMREPVSVGPDDTIETALERAVRNWLEDLPVCDSQGRVIGYLDCFEITLNVGK